MVEIFLSLWVNISKSLLKSSYQEFPGSPLSQDSVLSLKMTHCRGFGTICLRLELEPMCQDSNPARTHGLPTEITLLVSGPDEAQVLDVSLQKEFSEKQSMSKKGILFREKHTPQTECQPSQRVNAALKCGVVSYYGLGNFIG